MLIDRIGKGIRTAPRDAMISLSTPERQLGAAFGVHRALDTTGAMIGPLLAFGLLALAPLAFNSIFLVSFCIALIGLGVLVLLVQPKQARDAAEAPSQRRAVAARGRRAARASRATARSCSPARALSLATAATPSSSSPCSDKLDLGTSLFPLLFVGSATAYMVLAVPMGKLADRFGRGPRVPRRLRAAHRGLRARCCRR